MLVAQAVKGGGGRKTSAVAAWALCQLVFATHSVLVLILVYTVNSHVCQFLHQLPCTAQSAGGQAVVSSTVRNAIPGIHPMFHVAPWLFDTF